MKTITKPLTAREKQILCHARHGRKNKQIARDLGISADTVKNHLRSVFLKLGVETRTQAVVEAINSGVIGINGDERG